MFRLSAILLVLAFSATAPGEVEHGRDRPEGPLPPLPEGVELAALLTDSRLSEISGLAASRRHPGIFWVHNDSHDANALYAIDVHGRLRATLRLPVPNIDWEDIAAFERNGRAYLLVADTGDNGGVRTSLVLHVLEEPETLEDAELPPAAVRSLHFRWPDGPRDCEAVAVDAQEAAVYLIAKKRVPPQLFRLELLPEDARSAQVARRVGELSGIVQPSDADLARSPVFGKYRSQITAADIASDGSYLAVMNYLHLYLWPKDPEGWAAAVARPPQRRDLPWMVQAEAMGFSHDGASLWLSSERLPAPLIRMWRDLPHDIP